jgi:hypothetical protein
MFALEQYSRIFAIFSRGYRPKKSPLFFRSFPETIEATHGAS